MSEASQGSVHGRYQLARRVKYVLDSLESVELARIDDEIPLQLRPEDHGDFVIQALDLRLRVILLVGQQPNNRPMLEFQEAERAASLIRGSTDTDAVVLVFDDEPLTALIIEPFDVLGDFLAPTGLPADRAPSEGPAPLADVLDRYLRLLKIVWPPWTDTPSADRLDYEEIAADGARHAASEASKKRYRVPEKAAARDSLDASDLAWIRDVTRLVALREPPPDMEEAVRQMGQAP